VREKTLLALQITYRCLDNQKGFLKLSLEIEQEKYSGGKINIQDVTFATVQTLSKVNLNDYRNTCSE